MTDRRNLVPLALAAAVLAAGCQVPPAQPRVPPSATASQPSPRAPVTPASPGISSTATAHPLAEVHDPGHVTGEIGPASCHARDRGQLPDPACTPGAIDPAVTQQNLGSTICRTGWTATVRPPAAETEAFKFTHAYPAYGLASGTLAELDHLVPLELGGSNDAANLWPEPGAIPNPKDAVENALRRAVCAGRVGLRAAQEAVAADWLTALARLRIG